MHEALSYDTGLVKFACLRKVIRSVSPTASSQVPLIAGVLEMTACLIRPRATNRDVGRLIQ